MSSEGLKASGKQAGNLRKRPQGLRALGAGELVRATALQQNWASPQPQSGHSDDLTGVKRRLIHVTAKKKDRTATPDLHLAR